MPPDAEPPAALTTLLSGLIDYAGLYPPASLSMERSVANFHAYLLTRPEAWALGRFICPASRLAEFEATVTGGAVPARDISAAAGEPPPADGLDEAGSPRYADEIWTISAIIDGDPGRDLDAIAAFNRRHANPETGAAIVDAVEVKAASAAAIDSTIDLVPDEIFPFFEVPLTGDGRDARGLIAALAGSDAGAKIRTGGVTPGAFPTPEAVIAFIQACDAADVPFKATAGLHHPVRAEHNLTYEPDSPRAVMHGFLNVFMAAAMIRARAGTPADALAVLTEADPARFRFTDEAATCRNRRVSTEDLAVTREQFALSYGSCSFEEPIEDLKRLKMLP